MVDLIALMNQPHRDQALLAEAGISLDRALFALLVGIERFGPIGVVELSDEPSTGCRLGEDTRGGQRSAVERQSAGSRGSTSPTGLEFPCATLGRCLLAGFASAVLQG
ncbi:hypothetical protein WME75_42850 [Sorangium sp. So ce1014]|uniref:hypothetical protein n=1 Tax=Sorangium sp. So ce1014 TaxID=3133326 RepID=UPI003F63F64F